MTWVGKAVGGTLGLFVGGPLGSALGLILGHQFDRGLARRTGEARSEDFASERVQPFFFETTFAVMGHIAKADGRVSEQAIRAARLVMHGMKLSPEQVNNAVANFTAGKDPGWPFAATVEELRRELRDRPDLKRAFIEIQMQAAISAGPLDRTRRELLWQVARGLGIGRVELAQIEALARAQQFRARGQEIVSLDEAHNVLGVEPSATDQDVKTAYRRLMNQHHPDKLVSRGLPESMMGVAEKKTQEIRAAYERIKSQRAFK